MGKAGFYDLDKEKQEEFLHALHLRGLDPRRVIGVHLDSERCGGEIRINSRLSSSHVITYFRTMYSVAQLKALGGTPDAAVALRDPDLTEYPPEPSFDVARVVGRYSDPRGLGLLLGAEGRANVKQAMRAYLSGDSRRVISLGYEPIINALHFPMRVTTSAVESITVYNGQTCTFGTGGDYPSDTTVLNITMYGTGTLKFLSDSSIACTNELAQLPA